MKKHLKFLLLTPFSFAVICESDDFVCGVEEPDTYVLNVENIAEDYMENDTIWINTKTSAMLVNGCTETTDPELILDPKVFLDGLFILRLGSFSDVNAQVYENADMIFDIGSKNNSNQCRDIQILPELTADNLFYTYRLGISISEPGDYCIVSSRDSYFNIQNDNNAQIFSAYNTLNNMIKFKDCGNTFIRNGAFSYYFLRIN